MFVYHVTHFGTTSSTYRYASMIIITTITVGISIAAPWAPTTKQTHVVLEISAVETQDFVVWKNI